MKTNEQIAKDLREPRGDRKREEVAMAAGVSASAIAMYESGDRVPRDEVKAALAKFYNMTVGELFFGEKGHKV